MGDGRISMGDGGRYELKYVVEESRAQAIVGFVRGYLQPSPYNRAGLIPGEPVASLYFDSPDLLFYRQAAGGLRNRTKLRVRYYDDDGSHPAYLEIKRRVRDVIRKDREMVARDVVREVLCSGWPSLLDGRGAAGTNGGARPLVVRQEFSHLCRMAQARAMLYVTYVREAYVGTNNGELRVTLDRQIRGTAYEQTDRIEVPRRGVRPDPLVLPADSVVLELKFTGTCPRWMQDMVRVFNLYRRSVSKYCLCAEALGFPRRRPDQALPQQWTMT